MQRLELPADRLVEVEEYQHGRLGCRGPRLRRRRGRGPRHHRGERPLAAGHGRRRRHPSAGAVAVSSSSVGADGDSATALPRSPRPPRVFATWRCLPPGFLGWLRPSRPSACGRGRWSGFGLASRWLLFPGSLSLGVPLNLFYFYLYPSPVLRVVIFPPRITVLGLNFEAFG